MRKDEKRAFWKFFLSYFISVALLILAAGYLYFSQMKQQLLKEEHFSLIEYAKHLKVGEHIESFEGYEHKYVKKTIENFTIDNFVLNNGRFEKWVPANQKGEYIFIAKSSRPYNQRLERLFYISAATELALLVVFGFLSFLLARNAMKPLQQNIERLDRFAKDLIHDLNTPVTSIGLNIKMLNKEACLKNHKAIERLQKSANEISDLHKNLTFLLKENRYELEKTDIKELVETLLHDYRNLYPELSFVVKEMQGHVMANRTALRQILDNLLSNACKYSHDNGTIELSFDGRRLSISDDGIGIKNPERIFERNYTEHLHSSGIGLDIVKRLCETMNIDIKVASAEKGTAITLTFG